MNLLETLQNNPQLNQIPSEQLTWLIENAQIVDLEAGAFIFERGKPAEYLQIILSGRVEVYFMQNGQKRDFGVLEKDAVTGILPYSRMKEVNGFGKVIEKTTVLRLPKERFPEMISQYYELTEAFVHLMTSRVREGTKQQQLNEKMLSLGKLSAGLAHELNNPAAAVVRSSLALKKHLSGTPEKFKKILAIRITEKEVDEANQVLFNKINQKERKRLSLLAQNQLEDELLDWLENYQVEDAFDIAPILMEFGFEVEDLEKIKEIVSENHTDAVVNWMANNLITEKIVDEIEEASKRISHLITSIKSYSHMDKAQDKTKTNIQEGIENTLSLLNHKLKTKNIEVMLNIPDDLPLINAYGGELNQVWTNLIDNAIDAMADKGKLEIVSKKDREFVVTDIIDNGVGISQELLSQIFDPFFTTKDIGKGTGLGLDIVQKIINNHRGKVTVMSEGGKTNFSVCLPID